MAPPGEFQQRLQTLIKEIHSAPTAAGIESVLLPGEREWKLYHQALAEGIRLPADVEAKLASVAQEFDLPLGHSA